MRRVMCIHLPFLATDLATRGDGRQVSANRPLVLTRPSTSSVFVAHACPRALAGGVRTGMSLAEARAVLPELVALPHEPQRDATTLEHLALWAQRFGPTVQSVRPNALLLDVTGCGPLFGGEENIARQAVAGLASRGVCAKAAIAETAGAAWALAWAAAEPAVVVPPGQIVPYLTPLPPEALRLDAGVVETLEGLGICTVGDLLMLPRASLPSRFGEEPVLRIQQALGEVTEWIIPPRRAPAFSARMAFGPADRLDVVLAALERIVRTLCQQLVTGGAAARRLLGAVYFERRGPASVWVGLSRPSRDQKHLRALLETRIERVDLSAGATGLMVTATETAVWRAAQGDLFDDPERPDDERVGVLIDRLANYLGSGAVVRAEMVEDHQPERAFRYASLVERKGQSDEAIPTRSGRRSDGGTEGSAKGGKLRAAAFMPRGAEATERRNNRQDAGATKLSRDPQGSVLQQRSDPPSAFGGDAKRRRGESDRTRDLSGAPVGQRPLRLLARPQAVRVMALVPDGPPAWFWHRGREYVVSQAAGPERLETGWWRGSDVRRDYFHVVTESGQQFWVFRDLKTKQWFLHGSYE